MFTVHCRRLEDGSGYGVFAGQGIQYGPSIFQGGKDKWEKVLGVGSTIAEAWKCYHLWKK